MLQVSSARIVERTLELIRNPQIGRDAFLKSKGIRVVNLEAHFKEFGITYFNEEQTNF